MLLLLHFCICFFQIYEFGVIALSEGKLSNCPPTPGEFDGLGETVIAVYWIPAQINGKDSDVFFRMKLSKEPTFNMSEVKGFVEEINQAGTDTENFKELDAGAIQSIIYITWVNLKQLPGTLAEVSIKYVNFTF